MSDDTQNTEKKSLVQIYAAFGAALVLSVVPTMAAAIVSLILVTGVLITAYAVRGKHEHGSLSENHMTFVIRTIWIGSLIATITMLFASAYLLFYVDNTPLNSCISTLMNMGEQAASMDMAALKRVFQPCMDGYLGINMSAFITSGLIVAVPTLIYFVARYARGLSRVIKGYRVAQPLHWF